MSDKEDVESMIDKWEDFESLTLQGLYVLMAVIEKEITERTKDAPDQGPLLSLPENPHERPCWACRRWIKVGTQCLAFADGKTYHPECKKAT